MAEHLSNESFHYHFLYFAYVWDCERMIFRSGLKMSWPSALARRTNQIDVYTACRRCERATAKNIDGSLQHERYDDVTNSVTSPEATNSLGRLHSFDWRAEVDECER